MVTTARIQFWKSDAVVNICILVTCVVLISVGLQNRRNSVPSQNGLTLFKVGQKADVFSGVDYHASAPTYVLYVKSTCPYCTQSMPFYRQLRQTLDKLGTGRIVTVSPEPIATLKQYLKDNELEVHHIVSSTLHPQNTPTVLRVDSNGVITGIWYGEQQDSGQRQILKSTGP